MYNYAYINLEYYVSKWAIEDLEKEFQYISLAHLLTLIGTQKKQMQLSNTNDRHLLIDESNFVWLIKTVSNT